MIENLRKILKGEIAPVYLVIGSSGFLVHTAVEEIKKAALAGGVSDFNLDTFRAGKGIDNFIRLSQIVRTMPMMAKRRVVVVYRCEDMLKDQYENINELVKEEIDSCAIILAGASFDKRTAVAKMAKSHGTLIEFGKLKNRQIVEWIKKFVTDREKTITSDAAEFLATALGENLERIQTEIEKASLFIGGEKTQISRQDLEEVMAAVKHDNVFGLMDAFGKRQQAMALQLLNSILDAGVHPIPLHASLYGHLKKLLTAGSLLREGYAPNDAARALGGSPFYAGKIVDQSRSYHLNELRRAILILSRVDFALKNSRVKDQAVLEKMVLDLCNVKR